MTYIATPKHKNPWSGGNEIHNFGKPFLGYHFYTLSLSEPCPWVEKKIFLRNTSILHFLPQNYLPLGWGHEIYNICLLTLQMLHTKFG